MTAKRNKNNVAVMFSDVDKFKPVNDTYGHKVGDNLLQALSLRISSIVRETDTVSRFGEDEFVIALSDLKQQQDVTTIAEKLVTALSKPYNIGTHQIQIGASLGISQLHNSVKAESLIEEADDAMYVAKRKGGNAYYFYNISTSNVISMKNIVRA
ncbi:MAG: diguanylate cyclase (GGDEF)-like protein [Candidatus Endobugula sp.]